MNYVISCLLFFFLTNAFAQQAVVLLKGKVIQSGKSNSRVEMQFKDESGSLVRASSSSDGSYQTVLKPGHRYNITVTDENLIQNTFSYEIPNYDRYTELQQDFPITASVVPAQTTKTQPEKKTKTKKSKKSKKGK